MLFLWFCNIWRYIKKTSNLDTAKASQESDIPTKILKQNSDYFAEYFCWNINQCISKSIFPPELKLADVTPVYKKKPKNSKYNYRSLSYPAYLKFMKDAFMIEFRFSLILFFPNISVGFEEATMHNTAW